MRMPVVVGIAALLASALAIAYPLTIEARAPLVQDGASEAVQAWSKAMEAGDIDAIVRMNPEGAVAFPPDVMVQRGTKEIADGYRQLFAKYKISVNVEDTHFIREDDLLISWGFSTLTLTPRDGGAPVVSKVRFTDVARRNGDAWEYILDHASKPQ